MPGPITDPSQVDTSAEGTGLPTDADGNLMSAEDAGSDVVAETDQPHLDLSHPAGDIPAPHEFSNFLEHPTDNSKTSSKVGVSVSGKGITPSGQKAAGGLFGDADKRIGAYSAQDAEDSKVLQARADEHYGNLKAATGQEFDVTKKYEEENQKLQQRLVDFNTHAANVEKQIYGETQAERARYISDYKQQLAGVRQLAMQSGNPIGNLTAGQATGLMGAQFAQGFLAARGINIDVTGQIDRWVDRSIQEHQQQIANARQGAADTMHLYDIARQSSQDDYEARQRYRGFVITGLQTSVSMNAARFQSQIAMAHANEAVAKLQLEADATERSIGDQHAARVHADMMAEYDRAYKQGMISIESYKASLEKQKIEAEAAARKAALDKKEELVPISDPEAITGPDGKPAYLDKWQIPASDIEGVKKARESRAYTEKVYKQLDNLETLRKKAYDKYGEAPMFEKGAAVTSPEIREYQRARTETMQTIRQATTGKAFTEAETKEYLDMLPGEHAWQKGDNVGAIPQLREKLRGDFESDMNTYAKYGRGQKASPHMAAEYEAMQKGGKPVEQLDDKVSEAERTPAAAAVDLADAKDTVKPSKMYETFIGEDGNKSGVKGQPHNTVGVDLLARTYLDPHHARTAFKGTPGMEIPENDDILRKQAVEGLQRLAADRDPTLSGYASIVLQKLQSDPDELRSLLIPEFTATYKAR